MPLERTRIRMPQQTLHARYRVAFQRAADKRVSQQVGAARRAIDRRVDATASGIGQNLPGRIDRPGIERRVRAHPQRQRAPRRHRLDAPDAARAAQAQQKDGEQTNRAGAEHRDRRAT